MTGDSGDSAQHRGTGYRFSALVWAALHLPIFVAFYGGAVLKAVREMPPGYRLWLAPTFIPQAALLALLPWLVVLPISLLPRAYRFVAPAIMGLYTAAIGLDAAIYRAVGYHMNGFFLRVITQPNAIQEAGVQLSEVALYVGAAVAFIALEIFAGSRFIFRFSARRRVWSWAVVILLLSGIERVYGGVLAYFGGPAVFAASMVLPLQAPVRMNTVILKVTGKPMVDPFGAGKDSARLPTGVDPEKINFTSQPDVIVFAAESLPAAHFNRQAMPNLWRRAAENGANFTRYYSGASSTNYSLFSLFYGLHAQKLDATVGAGRRPLLFPTFRHNGYQMRVSAASCVRWMELRETVFGGVRPDELVTWCNSDIAENRDQEMLADALSFVDRADDRPIFLFLFSYGTHFPYFSPPGAPQVFQPAWDGKSSIDVARIPGPMIKNRALNAAHVLDAWLEPFLNEFEQKRGKRPLLFFTGDHGEDFWEKGQLGHASDVTDEQVHVPFVIVGGGVPRGTFDEITGHVDFVPTLFGILGDTHPPALYADGMSVFNVPEDRFITTTVGWEPLYAAIGRDLKVRMYAGLAGFRVTDPDDRPLPDGDARLVRNTASIMRALRGENGPTASSTGASPEQRRQ